MKKVYWALLALAVILVMMPMMVAKAVSYVDGDTCPKCGAEDALTVGYFDESRDGVACGICGKLIQFQDHILVDATCMKPALCQNCGVKFGDKDPSAHDWDMDNWTSDDTSHWHVCKNGCGERKDEELHTGTAYCNAKAECKVCGKEYGEVDLDNHAPGKFHPATCVKEAYCEVEDRIFDEGRKDPNNHAGPIGDVKGTAATCTEPGLTDGKKCSACGTFTVEQQVIEKKEHVWKEATCTEPKTCDACGATEGSAAGHKEVTDPAVEATCTETGLTEGKHCSVCNAVLQKQKVVEKKGHTWKTATCTEPKTCTVCGATEGGVSGHKEVIDPGKPATCGQSGLTEGKHCSICGEVLVAQKVIPATVHWYGPWTPAGEGTHTGDCRRCGDPKTVDCELIEVELASGTIRMCPICGYVEGGEPLTAVEDAKATGAVPESDLVVFALEDGKLFTVAFEIGGKLLQPTGKITLTLPAGTAEVDFGREKAAVVKTKE